MKSPIKISDKFPDTPKMPVLFLGHGSPMNAIEDNEFVRGFRKVSSEIAKPNAILCISAHWETRGTYFSASERPETIYDFYGFPKELYQIKYPAPGSPDLALSAGKSIKKAEILMDHNRGLDHGAWSVIKHLYPEADVPVVQMSLDRNNAPRYHYELARELSGLREKGVLILGSGNIVHNLGMVDWKRLGEENYAYDWAIETCSDMKKYMLKGDHKSLIDYPALSTHFRLSIPTPEHFLPLLYVLALQEKGEELSFFNDKAVGGSIMMTSVLVGK